MKKIRELLQLVNTQGLSVRQASKIVGINKSSASEYLSNFKSCAITIEQIAELSDSDLLSALTGPVKKHSNERYQQLISHFTYIEKELKRPGVTLQCLWQELFQERGSYSYSQFCYHYQQWSKKQKVSMHIEHKAGEKMYVDYTGVKQEIIDSKTGEITQLEVFVAVLGSSQKCYIEAVKSQKKEDWIKANENALRFFGGVPRCIVPDCLKSAVIKANRYEPEINETFKDFATYYNTVILPARALHPQDKALAENFVKTAYTRIFAPLRNIPFYSIDECNQAMWEQLDKHNNMPFQGKEYSRAELFESIEKKELQPLPVTLYEIRNFSIVTVAYNHHVYLKEDKHYYSVPFHLTGKKVQLSYTHRTVEVIYNNQREATHTRSSKPYQYSTEAAHRPPNHQFIAEWSSERFIQWASKISPLAQQFINNLIESKAYPEQAFITCMGILKESKKYPKDEFNKACFKAIEMKAYTYKFIKNTLENKTYNLTNEEELQKIIINNDIRGLDILN